MSELDYPAFTERVDRLRQTFVEFGAAIEKVWSEWARLGLVLPKDLERRARTERYNRRMSERAKRRGN